MTDDEHRLDPDYDKHGGFPKFEPARPGPGFGRFLTAMRRAQDLAVSANPDRDTWDAAADRVEELVELLAPFEAGEGVGPANRVPSLPGAGSLLMPPYQVTKFEADIIVSGGRGMQKPENFQVLRELAEVLGGAVGASRAAVDAGWVPYSHQVGQTGKTVCPKLYIACGISGSVQHMAGMQSSDFIIAINTDPHADIFQIANLGIVGNALEVVPALTQAFKQSPGR